MAKRRKSNGKTGFVVQFSKSAQYDFFSLVAQPRVKEGRNSENTATRKWERKLHHMDSEKAKYEQETDHSFH